MNFTAVGLTTTLYSNLRVIHQQCIATYCTVETSADGNSLQQTGQNNQAATPVSAAPQSVSIARVDVLTTPLVSFELRRCTLFCL